jgi:hypothetical protein
MRRVARITLVVALAALFVGSAAPAAEAEFGPIQLISKSAREQADEAFAPAISADGHYVAWAGRLGGRFGLFRTDLQTGAVALVSAVPGREAARTANPSISADGRFVAFTTTAPLDPVNDLGAESSDVYVADMAATPPSYEIASALNGCDPATSATPCGLSYAGPLGSVASSRFALSEDGRSVVFLVKGESNLSGDPQTPETSAGQVAVRRLGLDETVLITDRRGSGEPEPVPGGGAATVAEGAAISGDGSTVAWVGVHLPEQVPMLADEEAAVRELEAREPVSVANEYHEPLWRRVPSPLDPEPPTRRVVGGGDPLAPGCPATGTLADPTCQGPFPEAAKARSIPEFRNDGRGWGLAVPRLDRSGEEVVFAGDPDEGVDLYLADMAPGLSRRQAVRRLSRWVDLVPGAPDLEDAFSEKLLAFSGPIADYAISPDGNRIAFTTARQVFPLAPPSLVTPVPGGVVAELYQVDLRGETIERVTPGGSAAASDGEASAPAYDGDGRLLAFGSLASNLIGGDTNEAGDDFVVESPLPSEVEQSAISRRPPSLVTQPLWRMTVDAASLPDGRIRVTVGVPGAGTLGVKAAARLGRHLKLRRVGNAHRSSSAPGVQRLDLRLPRKLRGLARKKGGVYAQIDIGFSGAGGRPLRAELDARFVVHRRKAKR